MKIIKFICIFAVAALLASCNKFLDTLPDNRAIVEGETGVAQILVNAYPLYHTDVVLEWMSDNVDFNGADRERYNLLVEEAFYWQDITDEGLDSPHWSWRDLYLAIGHANLALKVIDELGGNTDELRHSKAEALLCRAYAHFMLVNIFCLHYDPTKERDDNDYTDPNYYGIPYVSQAGSTPEGEEALNRKNVGYVYERINRDIEEALPLIEGINRTAPRFHFNKEAAYAFASKFNLYYCKFEKAVEYATVALGPNPKEKLRNWAKLEGTGDLTTRGQMYIDYREPNNFMMTAVRSYLTDIVNQPRQNAGTRARYTHTRYIGLNETVRASGFWGSTGSLIDMGNSWTNNPTMIVEKLYRVWESTNPRTNTGYPSRMLLHFTADETLMHRAEAYAMLGEYDKALGDINTILSTITDGAAADRAVLNATFDNMEYYAPGAPTIKKRLTPKFELQAGEQENFIHAILFCRRFMFLHEGHRWFDVKRWGITVHRCYIVDGLTYESDVVPPLQPDDKRRAIQLPLDVISAGMAPNPR